MNQTIELNKIYNEDCLETLARMEDNSIDLVVTSPPYNKNFYAPSSGKSESWAAMRGRQIPYDVYNDSMPPQEYEGWQKKIISECLRVLKPSGSLFYNHKDILVDGALFLLNTFMTLMCINRLSGIGVLHWQMTHIIFNLLPNISTGLSRTKRNFSLISQRVLLDRIFGE